MLSHAPKEYHFTNGSCMQCKINDILLAFFFLHQYLVVVISYVICQPLMI